MTRSPAARSMRRRMLGLHVDLFAPDHFTGELQAPVVDAVTARSPTITIISPADANGVTRPLKQMADRGTKIITVDTVVADPSLVASQVITSNIDGGKTAAAAMNEAIGGKGPVLVITNPPGSVAQDERAKGFEQGLKSASGVTYLGPQYQNDDPQRQQRSSLRRLPPIRTWRGSSRRTIRARLAQSQDCIRREPSGASSSSLTIRRLRRSMPSRTSSSPSSSLKTQNERARCRSKSPRRS